MTRKRILAAIMTAALLFGMTSCKLTSCHKSEEETQTTAETGKTVEQMIDDKNHREADFVLDDVAYAKKTDVSAYLFMGIDKSGDLETTNQAVGGQSDVLLLFVVDTAGKTQTILQLDRDTMADVEITNYYGKPMGVVRKQQICFAHTYGSGDEKSCENTVRAVSRLLGVLGEVQIDGYVSLLYDGIPPINDTLGGIKVKIEDDFSDADPTLVEGEVVELTGQHALNFVRGRMTVGDGRNQSRMRRQRAYMDAFSARLKEEMHTRSAIINDLYAAAEPYMVTDMSLGAISNLALQTLDYESGGTLTIDGELKYEVYPNGNTYTEFHVDEDSLRDTVLALFYTPIN